MLTKHLGLPKFYAPSKVLTLGAKEFSGEGGRSVKTFTENLRREPRELYAASSSSRSDKCSGPRDEKNSLMRNVDDRAT
jgi:hypothetical protein